MTEIITTCRFCSGPLIDVIHLGDKFPLAGGFMRSITEIKDEKLYPLSLVLCQKCHILHCKQVIDPDILFKKGYFYYSSSIPFLVSHFSSLAEKISEMYTGSEPPVVVEIGCNDGVLLKPLVDKGCKVIGVDPSATVRKLLENPSYEIYNDYLTEEIVQKILCKHPDGCDLFVSSNSFAHIHDMKTILRCMKKLLKPEGRAIIEVHYAKNIITDFHFDFIYHEHLHYFTVSSFSRIAEMYDFSLVDVEFIPVHGGSIRVYLSNRGGQQPPEKVQEIIDQENKEFLNEEKTYFSFSEKILEWKEEFLQLLSVYRQQGRKIYGYGSSGRANIICVLAGIILDDIFDDSPAKISSITPMFHQTIKSTQSLIPCQGDVFVILAWPYQEDICRKIKDIYLQAGIEIPVMVIPLPKICVKKIDGIKNV